MKTLLWSAAVIAVLAAIIYAARLGPVETLIFAVLILLLFGNRLPPEARHGRHDQFDRCE